MKITTNHNSDTPIYLQITNQLKEMIIREEISDGFFMPSERKMAIMLGVHRNTIIRAYAELKAEGYLETVERKGYMVCNRIKTGKGLFDSGSINWSSLIKGEYIHRRIETHFSNIFRSKYDISFTHSELPDSYCHSIFKILLELAHENNQDICYVTHRKGALELRKKIVDFVKSKGINAKPGEIQISYETYQIMEYIGHLMLNQGDVIIIEEPACPDLFRVFQACGAKIIAVGMDEEGILCDELESLIIKYSPKLIYVNPDFQNPTGICMSLERRKKLLDLSYHYKIPILEEDVYSEVRFEGKNIPSLKALDSHNNVIFLYSFIGTLSSGLRLAFAIADEALINDISRIVYSRVVSVDSISQAILKKYFEKGLFENQLADIRKDYLRKRNVMIESLKIAQKYGLDFQIPEGGSYLWCSLPKGVSANLLMEFANKRGVTCINGNVFFLKGSKGGDYIRLNFSYHTEEEIKKGIALLTDALIDCTKYKQYIRLK